MRKKILQLRNHNKMRGKDYKYQQQNVICGSACIEFVLSSLDVTLKHKFST